MAEDKVTPNVMLNSIMGKIYDVLTNGDETVPKSEDNFFSWATPGIPVNPDDFRFLKQGLTGVVRKAAVDEFQGTAPSTAGDASANATPAARPELTPAQIESLKASDTAQLYMQAESFARLVDFVPDIAADTNNALARLTIMNNEGMLSDRYEYLMRWSQVAETELDDKTKAKIEKFRNLLTVKKTVTDIITDEESEITVPSPMSVAYHDGLAAYETAALQYNAPRIEALAGENSKAVHYWAMNANILRNRVRAAMEDWVSTGYKNDYEKISAFIDQVMRRDMALLKQQYMDDLDRAKLTGLVSGSDFYYASLVPGNPFEASGWTEFGFTSVDFNNSSKSSYQFNSGTAGSTASFMGFCGGSGTLSTSSQNSDAEVRFDSSNFSMKFSIAQVPIVRPWFKTAFLTGKSWRMNAGNPNAVEVASDGNTPAKGLLPAYPTSLILIKDLVMSAGNSEGFSKFADSSQSMQAHGGGYAMFGPFVMGGAYTQSSTSGQRSSESHYDATTQTMRVPGYQIIGFKCHILPKSPNPLSTIENWI